MVNNSRWQPQSMEGALDCREDMLSEYQPLAKPKSEVIIGQIPSYVRKAFLAKGISFQDRLRLHQLLERAVILCYEHECHQIWCREIQENSMKVAEPFLRTTIDPFQHAHVHRHGSGDSPSENGLLKSVASYYRSFMGTVDILAAAADYLDMVFTMKTFHKSTRSVCIQAFKAGVCKSRDVYELRDGVPREDLPREDLPREHLPREDLPREDSMQYLKRTLWDHIIAWEKSFVQRLASEKMDEASGNEQDSGEHHCEVVNRCYRCYRAVWKERFQVISELMAHLDIADIAAAQVATDMAVSAVLGSFRNHQCLGTLRRVINQMEEWYQDAYKQSYSREELFHGKLVARLFEPNGFWISAAKPRLLTFQFSDLNGRANPQSNGQEQKGCFVKKRRPDTGEGNPHGMYSGCNEDTRSPIEEEEEILPMERAHSRCPETKIVRLDVFGSETQPSAQSVSLTVSASTLFESGALLEWETWRALVSGLVRGTSAYESLLQAWGRLVTNVTTQVLKAVLSRSSDEQVASACAVTDQMKVKIITTLYFRFVAMVVTEQGGTARTPEDGNASASASNSEGVGYVEYRVLKEYFGHAFSSVARGELLSACLVNYIEALWVEGCEDETSYLEVLPVFRVLEDKALLQKLLESKLISVLLVHRINTVTGLNMVINLLKDECGDNYVSQLLSIKSDCEKSLLQSKGCNIPRISVRALSLRSFQTRQIETHARITNTNNLWFPQDWKLPGDVAALAGQYADYYKSQFKHRLLIFDLRASFAHIEDRRTGDSLVVSTSQYLVMTLLSQKRSMSRAEVTEAFGGDAETAHLVLETLSKTGRPCIKEIEPNCYALITRGEQWGTNRLSAHVCPEQSSSCVNYHELLLQSEAERDRQKRVETSGSSEAEAREVPSFFRDIGLEAYIMRFLKTNSHAKWDQLFLICQMECRHHGNLTRELFDGKVHKLISRDFIKQQGDTLHYAQ
ncbi:cullin family protein [Gregarina niphandrodes]|uniref:Cullin family protein n=1 Tax=Gregarina niphandrodes TaxID=110365 RepID=A0A023B9E3_GRENI|nr:cullin family protein [Gregarina niphandrodes]EZG72781.1 cullin family protein [Gregarina niphandrodes]|eukprot:XP_011129753.1 cullin family protein [Gregarina niphandrodes]